MTGMTREEALASPGETNAIVDAVLAGNVTKPVIDLPSSDIVQLPGGLVHRGEVIRTVQVQELKGVHEEALARALPPPVGGRAVNWAHFLTVLTECGTVRFGDLGENPKDLLKDVLLGDRDALILGIRRATYGDTVDMRGWQCPACGGHSDLAVSLTEDLEVVTLDDPRQAATFSVPLRAGRSATVRLATCRDLEMMWEHDGLNHAERESIELSRCLLKITDANGTETRVQGRATGAALELSIPDRKAIINELNKRQPGPRYNSVRLTHQDCHKEVSLVIGLGDLFPDLF